MKNLFLIISLFLFLKISAQTNTWDGSTDTDWHKTCNWTLDLIPTCNHDVVIPTVTNYPIVTGTAHSLSLSITSAATNALEINSGVGGILYISSSGGSCSGTATDNGGCTVPGSSWTGNGGLTSYFLFDSTVPCSGADISRTFTNNTSYDITLDLSACACGGGSWNTSVIPAGSGGTIIRHNITGCANCGGSVTCTVPWSSTDGGSGTITIELHDNL